MYLSVVTTGNTLQIVGLTPGIATIISLPSTKVFSNLINGIYAGDDITVQVTGCTQGTYSQTVPAFGVFNPTTVVSFIENSKKILRETDQTLPFNVELQNTVPPFDLITIPITVKVIYAGQSKILSK